MDEGIVSASQWLQWDSEYWIVTHARVCVHMGVSGVTDYVYVPVYPPSETLQHWQQSRALWTGLDPGIPSETQTAPS